MNTFPLETFTENLLPLYPGYHITENGTLYSKLSANMHVKQRNFWKIRKVHPDTKGYLTTKMIRSDRLKRTVAIHCLVALAYIGERPKGLQICHNDGDRLNNHKSNLRYDTPKANSNDTKRHGRTMSGQKMHKSVLKDCDIIDIFNLACSGLELKQIAKNYKIASTAIGQVIWRKSWTHIEVDSAIIKKAQQHASSGLNLSEQDVINIFWWRSQKIPKIRIARHFGVADKTIRDILDRKLMAFVCVDERLIKEAQQQTNKYFRQPKHSPLKPFQGQG